MKKRIISIFIIFSMVVSFLNVLGSLYSVKAADEVVFKYSQVINPETQEAEISISGCNPLEGNIDLVIPESIDGIPVGRVGGFENMKNIVSVQIPDTVWSINNKAFSGTSIKTVTIPASVQIIRSGFENCKQLESAKILCSPKEKDLNRWVNCFSGCTNLKTVEIKGSLTSIPTGTFENCSSISVFEVPKSVLNIKANAFKGCTNLTNIYLSENLKTIQEGAFEGCSSLEYIDFPDSLTSIGNTAFINCRALKLLELPEQLATIGYSAFYNCRSLEQIVFNNSITTISDRAFGSCASLSTVYLPDSVVSVGNGAFQNCSNLTYVKFGNTASSTSVAIKANAFRDCGSLKGFECVKPISTIGEHAFDRCVNLSYFDVNGKIARIEDYAFYNCSRLVKFKSESNVIDYTGKYVFYTTQNEVGEKVLPEVTAFSDAYSKYTGHYLQDILDIPFGMNTIVGVYRSNTQNVSQLSKEDQEIYSLAVAAIRESGITANDTYGAKIRKIHDWMVKNIAYDRENYANDTIPKESYTILGALKNRICVCDAYAQTFKLFMDMFGIDCIYVSGQEPSRDGHAWNMVRLGTNWYHMDVTWDANRSHDANNQFSGTICNDNFLKSDAAFGDHLNIYTDETIPYIYPKASRSYTGNITEYKTKHTHTFNMNSAFASCKNPSYKIYRCSSAGCGYAYESNFGNPLGHSGKASTCSSPAICGRCKAEYRAIDFDKHNFLDGACTDCGLKLGDIDCDGEITPIDAFLLAKYLAEHDINTTEHYLIAANNADYFYLITADIDQDGEITAYDSYLLRVLISQT